MRSLLRLVALATCLAAADCAEDAASRSPDAGLEPPDAELADSGVPGPDASSIDGGRDAAQASDASPADASETPDGGGEDANPAPDAGAPPDAAALPDAAEPPDAEAPDGSPGCIEGAFTAYRGNLHSHTSYSDGKLTPADAFDHARDAGLDILEVTDHGEQIGILNRWADCNSQADSKDAPGQFVAACGYEYGAGYTIGWPPISTGHNNVFFTDSVFAATALDFHDFYSGLVACASCVGQFNHPGSDSEQSWNDFEYHADVDARMALIEFNGGGPVWDLYFEALGKGWHLSPTWDQDNHNPDWGSKDETRSGLYLRDLSRAAVRDAMLERRTFASNDRNASIVLMAGNCWMGSRLTNQGAQPVWLHLTAEDPDPADGFATLELFGPGKALLGSWPCGGSTSCDAALALPVTSPTFVVGRATQADGDFLVSAPVWLSP